MAIDFSKKLRGKGNSKKINPLELYEGLDRKTIAGPLRETQEKILKEWFSDRRDNSDLIVKLHTGEGKTLIGLLILYSKLNENNDSCVYMCPNIHLAEQVMYEASKFGIPYCLIGVDNKLPDDFMEGKKILITTAQKLFNGKTIFGLDNKSIPIDSLVLDDSHACMDVIKRAFTIRISRNDFGNLYKEILDLFEDDLRKQREGSLLEIIEGEYEAFLAVPYWAWFDKNTQLANILLKYKDSNALLFVWPLLKNILNNCQAFISGSSIEITPYYLPIESFGSFHKAKHRVLMSATTQEDSFFIKGLGFDLEAVRNPLVNIQQKWSGEKMVLIPSLIDYDLGRDKIINTFANLCSKDRLFSKFGRVALVSSFHRAAEYEGPGSYVVRGEDVFKQINKFKEGSSFESMLVLVNRYDGVDLADDSCRILLIDSLPYFDCLSDKYEEQCRSDSDIINVKLAQKIEQGFGRSVRGEKDYSVIIITGVDLVKFIRSKKTKGYFSEQTQKQIEIGAEIAEAALESFNPHTDDAINTILKLIKQSVVDREVSWKNFYKEQMDEIGGNKSTSTIYEILSLERNAEYQSYMGLYDDASNSIQEILDQFVDKTNTDERGWYLQNMARFRYLNKEVACSLQSMAFQNNLELLKPRDGVAYKAIDLISDTRAQRIRNYFMKLGALIDFKFKIDTLLSDLTFGTSAEKFEQSLKEIGEIIGFTSQRPDKGKPSVNSVYSH